MTGERRADRAADVIAALGPVEAWAAEGAAARLRDRDAELGEEGKTVRGELARLLVELKGAALDERVGDVHREAAGEMVVAHACGGKRRRLRGDRPPARRRLHGGDGRDRLEHARDQRRGETEIAVAALAQRRQKVRLGQPAQMQARSCGETRAKKASCRKGQ